MNILANKIKVGKKFVAVLRCQYERQTRDPMDFSAVLLLKPKMTELLRISCGKNNYLLGTGKTTNGLTVGTSGLHKPTALTKA